METVLLLHSFGDYVIALYHLPNSSRLYHNYRLVASKHLEPLHLALFSYLSPAQQQVQFIDLGIQNHILAGFTHRYFFTKNNIQELKNLRSHLNGLEQVVLEQERRSWLIKLIGRSAIKTVHQSGNIYDSWASFYENKQAFDTQVSHFKNVAIFPDSRLQRKAIPENVLLELEQHLAEQGIQTQRAYFKKALTGTAYQNFAELVQLIADAEFIVSSDSLPAHIAQLLQKPHAILYAEQINHEWVTPFAMTNKTAFLFQEVKSITI